MKRKYLLFLFCSGYIILAYAQSTCVQITKLSSTSTTALFSFTLVSNGSPTANVTDYTIDITPGAGSDGTNGTTRFASGGSTVIMPALLGTIDVHLATTTTNSTKISFILGIAQAIANAAIIPVTLCNNDIVLPLTLLDFNVKPQEGNINVLWQTANEINFSRFELQRSADAQNFKTIAEIKGKGSGDYVFTDTEVEPFKVYYYRLKLLDKNGNFTYSNIKSASIVGKNEAQIYPNPTSGILNLSIKSNSVANINFDVINISGQIILNKSAGLNEGQNTIEISTSDFPVGSYSVRFNSGLDLPALRFVKN